MEKFIRAMFQYMKDDKIENFTGNYGELNLNDIIFEIVSWLKLEYKRTQWKKEGRSIKHRPLDLNMNYPWCQMLQEVLEKDDNDFSKYFIIINEKSATKFDFKETVNEQDKELAREIVNEKYNPQIMR